MKLKINQLNRKITSFAGKKLFFVALVATFITSNAFAGGEGENKKAASSLKKEFANAQNIAWKVTPNYIKASFTWNGQQLEVFYNDAGETIAESRIINAGSIPLKAQQHIQKKYPDYKIAEAIEYNNEESGISYYVSVIKGNEKIILQVSTQGDVSIYKP